MISIPNYNGTVLQVIETETKLWPTGEKKPTATSEVQVEGFFLKNGMTNLDLQTIRRAFDPAKVDRVEQTMKITLGAGTYNGNGVSKFEILEDKHVGGLKGKVAWAGKTTQITLKVTITKDGTLTFNGPWDKP